MTAMYYHSKNCYIGRIDTWDSRGLRKCLGTPLLQLFPALEPYSWASVVVKPGWNLRLLVSFGTLCGNLFLPNVPFISPDD